MKKLLNLFSGITLITIPATSVVACNNDQKPIQHTNWQKAQGFPKKEQYQITTIVKKIGSWYYLGTNKGLYISSDGVNWSVDKSIPNDANIAFVPTKINNIYYLGTSEGLYTSTDGATWNKDHALGLPYSPGFHNPLQKVGNIDYILTDEGLYMSTNGTNWSAVDVAPLKYKVQNLDEV